MIVNGHLGLIRGLRDQSGSWNHSEWKAAVKGPDPGTDNGTPGEPPWTKYSIMELRKFSSERGWKQGLEGALERSPKEKPFLFGTFLLPWKGLCLSLSWTGG